MLEPCSPFSGKDLARRTLQPRGRIHSMDRDLRRSVHYGQERRHSLGDPDMPALRDELKLTPKGLMQMRRELPTPEQLMNSRRELLTPDDLKKRATTCLYGRPNSPTMDDIIPTFKRSRTLCLANNCSDRLKQFSSTPVSSKPPWTRELPRMLPPVKLKSSIGEDSEPVVYVKDGCKGYGRGSSRKNVLQKINMKVRRGEIYGLLGASGCGKTTLLSIIVGKQNLESGDLCVFGGRPGDPASGIPGSRVGYMPQELALYEEFTVQETVDYFGKIYNMSPKQIRVQLEFLTSLLDLPQETRKISSFSGGQQRRVSFLISLLADPELLILDEPTVGVDPILRQTIWKHLLTLAEHRRKTIIITTHYIDETKMASRVGMLNSGRLLAEDSPANLMAQYDEVSLEDVFLKLCIRDKKERSKDFEEDDRRNVVFTSESSKSANLADFSCPYPKKEKKDSGNAFTISVPSFGNFTALLRKNFLKLRRNPAMLLFVFLLPAIQVIFFCVAIGQEPHNLRLGWVNHESDNCTYLEEGCDVSELGCKFARALNSSVDLRRYYDMEEAENAVRNGELWGLLHFKANFSAAYVARITSPVMTDNQTFDDSTMEVRLDMSNQQVALTLQNQILEAFDNFTKTMLNSCSFPQEAASLPIRWEIPIYGNEDPSFTEFMAPGIIILIIYFLAVALTGESFISERASGLLDRSWIAGVKPSEIIASHIVAQFLVMIVQTAVTLVTIIWGFKIPCRGPFVWLAVITVLQGLAGMSFGFLISALCDSQAVAMQLSIGSFYPNLLLSGILWPLEGMPVFLRKIAMFLPNTLACQAMRDIMLRGWGIDREEVYLGAVASSAWIVIFLLFSWLTIRFRS